MYSCEKSLRKEEEYRLKRNPPNSAFSPNLPSFSSSLLDHIFSSIDDGNEKKCEELKSFCKDRIAKKPSIGGGGVKAKRGSNTSVEDEETARLRRACAIEKSMEKKVGNKVSARRRQSLPEYDGKSRYGSGDPLFFSSSSTSSDSSSGSFSSSDTEVLSMARSRTSCFTISTRLKPVRTSASAASEKFPKDSNYKRSERHELDNCPLSKNGEDFKHGSGFIKSKLRASEIYSNLKKVKQPISPGGKFASFLNSLFTNGNTKKKKNVISSNGGYEDARLERNAKFTQVSNCSSASSYSRSCLTKTCKISSNLKEKSNNGVKRTVRFCPESTIVDEDRRPSCHKCIYKDNRKKFVSPTEEELNLQVLAHEIRKTEQSTAAKRCAKSEAMARNQNAEDDEDDDAASDSSSDLFELDHLAFGWNHHRYYCEELPLYESTNLDTDLAIA
ncbi:hypothetical protein U1Q18_036807 [Sarracenia purpurea var. burkii]